MTHDALRELTGAYALGALGSEEKRALEAHLASCDECAAEVRAFSGVVHGLNHAVPQLDPPASLRARVIARVDDLASRSAPSAPPAVSRPVQRFSNAGWLALAASLIAGALGFYAFSLRDRVLVLQRELADAEQRASAAEQGIQTVQLRASNLQRTADILAAADVKGVELKGQGPGSGASGRAFVSRSRGVVFFAENLPPLKPGTTYQLWVVTEDKKPIDAGVFTTDATGTISLTRILNVPNPGAVAVTVEPAGGVPSPTGPMCISGSGQEI